MQKRQKNLKLGDKKSETSVKKTQNVNISDKKSQTSVEMLQKGKFS